MLLLDYRHQLFTRSVTIRAGLMQLFIKPMKNRYRLYRRRRGGHFYVHDSVTGKQESLKTMSRAAVQRLLAARNAAVEQPQLNLALARTYLSAHDPKTLSRCWQLAMDYFSSRGRASTQDRSARAFAGEAFNTLRNRVIIETVAEDFLAVMKNRGPSVAHYLRRLQNLAMDLNWLSWPILAKAAWPKFVSETKRAITEDEFKLDHCHREKSRAQALLPFPLGGRCGPDRRG